MSGIFARANFISRFPQLEHLPTLLFPPYKRILSSTSYSAIPAGQATVSGVFYSALVQVV